MTKSSNNDENEEIKNDSANSIRLPLLKKHKRPISKSKLKMIKMAQKSLNTGELASADKLVRMQRDLRTLYIRYKDKQVICDQEEIKSLHKDIKSVRLARNSASMYAFAEFENEKVCEDAKASLVKNDSIYVDFVGSKSKSGGKSENTPEEKGKKVRKILPTRLMISGLAKGINGKKLKLLFPKCIWANIQTGFSYGFVQFHNLADAKSAFEATKKLIRTTRDNSTMNTISVAYARVSKSAYRAGMKHKTTKGIVQPIGHKDNRKRAINPHLVNGEESTQKNDNNDMERKEHSENKMVKVQDEAILEKCYSSKDHKDRYESLESSKNNVEERKEQTEKKINVDEENKSVETSDSENECMHNEDIENDDNDIEKEKKSSETNDSSENESMKNDIENDDNKNKNEKKGIETSGSSEHESMGNDDIENDYYDIAKEKKSIGTTDNRKNESMENDDIENDDKDYYLKIINNTENEKKSIETSESSENESMDNDEDTEDDSEFPSFVEKFMAKRNGKQNIDAVEVDEKSESESEESESDSEDSLCKDKNKENNDKTMVCNEENESSEEEESD